MYTNLPYIYEGEIVSVLSTPGLKKKNTIRYTVKVVMPNGSEILAPNAVETSIFGGIDDYFQQRARTSKDKGNKFEYYVQDAQNDARIGQRCYVSFIGGSFTAPVILAWAQHPNQTAEFESPDSLDPQAVLKYLGMRFDFKKDGVFRVTHFGAPKVKFVDSSTGLFGIKVPDLGGAAAGASAGGDAPNPIKPDKTNPAVTPADAEMRTFVEFSKKGGLEVRDALSQVIQIDTSKKRILIANNEAKGPSQKDTEFVVLDRAKQGIFISARKLVVIESLGDRKDETKTDHIHLVHGNEKITIDGDKTDKIAGGLAVTVTKDYKEIVKGTYTITATGAAKYKYEGELSIDAGAGFAVTVSKKFTLKAQAGGSIVVDGAKIAIGSSGTEVLKTLSETMKAISDILTAIGAMTVGTAMGPSSPPINAADFIKITTTVATLKGKLDAITGSL